MPPLRTPHAADGMSVSPRGTLDVQQLTPGTPWLTAPYCFMPSSGMK